MKFLRPGFRGFLVAVLVTSGALVVSCGGSEGPDDGADGAGGSGGSDGSSDSGAGAPGSGGLNVGSGGVQSGGGDGSGGSDGTCVGLNEACEANVECCDGRTCQDVGDGKRCIDESLCAGAGASCESAAECCSLSCDGACQDDGSLCSPVGTECTDDVECCSNDCDGTCQAIGEACSPVGERCDSEGTDDGCCSRYCENFGSEEEPDLRCSRSSTCGARGEICDEASDCCSGVCIDGRCPTQNEIGGQLFAGEPCERDAQCASYACAASAPGAPKTCQFLGGCRPAGEICTESWQCCSNLNISEGGGAMCLEDNATEGVGCEAHAIEGLSVCGLNTDPKEVGEICLDTEGNAVHDCCPSDNCELTATGVSRCAGGEGFDECRDDGDTCQVSTQCCSGVCSPVDTGSGIELRCGSGCIETDGLCTANADCCGGVCTNGTCAEETSECTPLGGECSDGSECCNLICMNGFCQTVVK